MSLISQISDESMSLSERGSDGHTKLALEKLEFDHKQRLFNSDQLVEKTHGLEKQDAIQAEQNKSHDIKLAEPRQ